MDGDASSPLTELLPLCDSADIGDEASPNEAISLNMWGDCRPDNYAKSVRRARYFKAARLALFTRVKSALEAAGIEYALYGGSALAVHREGGRMIAHDSDVDLVAREADFARLVDVGELLASGGQVACDSTCAMTGREWFEVDYSGQRSLELPYDGRGCKRLKFFLTAAGWSTLGPLRRRPAGGVPYDPCLVHLDIFTVSPHPLDSANCLRVNWSVPGLYDPLAKRFPADCLFPAIPCLFEGISAYAPRHLVEYLTVEYGYLGRDAVYDARSGLYVRMPDEVRARLRGMARVRLTGEREEDEKALGAA